MAFQPRSSYVRTVSRQIVAQIQVGAEVARDTQAPT